MNWNIYYLKGNRQPEKEYRNKQNKVFEHVLHRQVYW